MRHMRDTPTFPALRFSAERKTSSYYPCGWQEVSDRRLTNFNYITQWYSKYIPWIFPKGVCVVLVKTFNPNKGGVVFKVIIILWWLCNIPEQWLDLRTNIHPLFQVLRTNMSGRCRDFLFCHAIIVGIAMFCIRILHDLGNQLPSPWHFGHLPSCSVFFLPPQGGSEPRLSSPELVSCFGLS